MSTPEGFYSPYKALPKMLYFWKPYE